MKWVTRARPKTDRIACPWLIRRFIDPDAQIRYVPADQVLAVAEIEAARSFDAPDAEFTHRDNRCTFQVLIDAFGLDGDPALVRLARIVHAADIAGQLDSDPLGPGLLAIGEGGLAVEADDQRLLARACSSTTPCTPGANSTPANPNQHDQPPGPRRRPHTRPACRRERGHPPTPAGPCV